MREASTVVEIISPKPMGSHDLTSNRKILRSNRKGPVGSLMSIYDRGYTLDDFDLAPLRRITRSMSRAALRLPEATKRPNSDKQPILPTKKTKVVKQRKLQIKETKEKKRAPITLKLRRVAKTVEPRNQNTATGTSDTGRRKKVAFVDEWEVSVCDKDLRKRKRTAKTAQPPKRAPKPKQNRISGLSSVSDNDLDKRKTTAKTAQPSKRGRKPKDKTISGPSSEDVDVIDLESEPLSGEQLEKATVDEEVEILEEEDLQEGETRDLGTSQRKRRFKEAVTPLSVPVNELFGESNSLTSLTQEFDSESRAVTALKLAYAELMQIANGRVPTSVKKIQNSSDAESFLLPQLISGKLFRGEFTKDSADELVKESLKTLYTNYFNNVNLDATNPTQRVQTFTLALISTLERAKEELWSVLKRVMSLLGTLANFSNQAHWTLALRNTLSNLFEEYSSEMRRIPMYLDESCNRGLKPLRQNLTAPYFKGPEQGDVAPALFKRTKSLVNPVLLLPPKQKWTQKDVNELKTCILRVEMERQVHEINALGDARENQLREDGIEDENTMILNLVNQGRSLNISKKRFCKDKNTDNGNNSSSQTANILTREEQLAQCTNTIEIKHWVESEVRQVANTKFEQLFKTKQSHELIQWNLVSERIMQQTKKLRTAEDCKKCFIHAADPNFNNKRQWSEAEKELLRKNANNLDWTFGNNFKIPRTEFRVFYKWKTTYNRLGKFKWTPEKCERLRNAIVKYKANWDIIEMEIGDEQVTKKFVLERFKKCENPILRFGKFSRVEDCLLMLTIEKLKGQLVREKHFGILTSYLPWRNESAWRDRAENLFAEFIVPWTLKEDEQLLEWAHILNRDWSKISKKFDSFKTRKGCLTRYKILVKRLAKFESLEEYHHSYAMIRYNIREYQHLKDILFLLKRIIQVDLYSFDGLKSDCPPTESDLQDLILSFNKQIVASTIESIQTYIQKKDEHVNAWRVDRGISRGERKRTHDRRTFHPDNTQSIASAIHIRNLKLRPKENLNLTLRQQEIYKYYAQFTSTRKPLKKDKQRPYIPEASELLQFSEIRCIVLSPQKDEGHKADPIGENGKRRRTVKRRFGIE